MSRDATDDLAHEAVRVANETVGYPRYTLTPEGASEYRLVTTSEFTGRAIASRRFQLPHEVGVLLQELEGGARRYAVKRPSVVARLERHPPRR